ncbi:hypothetical protein Y1Q_0008791 [Alligator mississippiensis]|uniref:Uncharacterized protein n=1 Tax=Alligator mississippiensis TaxID=8496 RepID=A0A151N9Y0_ALLMI|nr:hypothetical protein Y1Q_0008791 [Alligator mississippiensis]
MLAPAMWEIRLLKLAAKTPATKGEQLACARNTLIILEEQGSVCVQLLWRKCNGTTQWKTSQTPKAECQYLPGDRSEESLQESLEE